MQYLLLGVLVASLGYWLSSQPQAKRNRYISRLVVMLLVGAALFLAITGRLGVLIAFFAALLPFARRLLPLLRFIPLLKLFRRRGTPSSTSTSEVVTAELKMSLDHSTGAIDGEVLIGQFKGRHLSDLEFADVLSLYEYCPTTKQDTRSLLVNYMEKMHAGEWSQHLSGQSSPGKEAAKEHEYSVTLDEAYRLLDLRPGVSRDDVIQAHRRLMSRVHPDKGGSSYLAARLNEAKERIIEELDK